MTVMRSLSHSRVGVVMTMSWRIISSWFFFGVLLLSLFSSYSSSVVGASDDDGKYVTCGSAIKLTHIESGNQYYLNSANQNFGSGSGQQVVTLIPDRAKHTSLWQIREGHGQPQCLAAEPIKCGGTNKIRLTHLETGSNLHSHEIPSPLSRQQEVSGFGVDGEGDTGDDWIVICQQAGAGGKGKGEYWERGSTVRLQHADTKKYLGASSTVKFTEQNCGGRCPILNHLEVFARSREDNYSLFKVELGVHLHK